MMPVGAAIDRQVPVDYAELQINDVAVELDGTRDHVELATDRRAGV